MRLSIALISLLGYTAIALGATARPVRADTYSFAAAMHKNGGGNVCLGWADSAETAVGMFSDADCPSEKAIMPLYWRTFGFSWTTRTVRVRAKRTSSSVQVSCTLYAVRSDGIVASQNTKTLTPVDAYGWIDLSVTNVTSTTTSFVACSMTGGKAYLLNVSYSP
jgi:hypothetical protein